MSVRHEGMEPIGEEPAVADPGACDASAQADAAATVAALPWLDRVIGRAIEWGSLTATWLPLSLLIAAAPALFLWPIVLGADAHLLDNKLPLRDRAIAGGIVAASLLVVGAAYALLARRAPAGERLEAIRSWNRRLLPLLALPILPFLLTPGVEKSRPWFVILFATAIGFFAAQAGWQRTVSLARLPGWLPGAIAIVTTLAWAVAMSIFSIGQHHALETDVYDLGIYDSIFWHSIHGEPLAVDFVRGGNHVSAHVDPILVLLSPLYLIYPRAELILVLQAVWVAAGAIPVWLLARRLLGSWYALGFVLVYLLLPSVHGRTLYHFHSLTLAGPLLLGCFACLELGWVRRFWVAFALLLLTREDMALLGAMLGLYALLAKGRRRLGFWAIAISIVYLGFLKLVVMPQPGLLTSGSSESYGYAFYYEDMIPQKRLGASGLLLSIVTNPIFVLQHVLTEPKLRFFALVFLPMLLLPLVAPRGRMLLLYGLAFIFLATRTAVFSPAFQYATTLDVLALGLAVITLVDLPQARWAPLRRLDPARARPALMAAMVAVTAVLSWKFGAFVPNDAFRAGFHRLVRNPSEQLRADYAWIRETVERIGPDASVSVSGRLGPHVSNRGDAYLWPSVRDADYILVEKRALKDTRKKLAELEKEGKYRRVREHPRFLLLERADRLPQPPTQDAGERGPAERLLETPRIERAIPGLQLQRPLLDGMRFRRPEAGAGEMEQPPAGSR